MLVWPNFNMCRRVPLLPEWGALFVPPRSTEALPSRAIKVTPLGKPTNHPYERFCLRFPGTAAELQVSSRNALATATDNLHSKPTLRGHSGPQSFLEKHWRVCAQKLMRKSKIQLFWYCV